MCSVLFKLFRYVILLIFPQVCAQINTLEHNSTLKCSMNLLHFNHLATQMPDICGMPMLIYLYAIGVWNFVTSVGIGNWAEILLLTV